VVRVKRMRRRKMERRKRGMGVDIFEVVGVECCFWNYLGEKCRLVFVVNMESYGEYN
jgi:hypothetical protein